MNFNIFSNNKCIFVSLEMGKKRKENCIFIRDGGGGKHAIQCESCGMWQHRKCNTGLKFYISGVIRNPVSAYAKPLAIFICNRDKL